MQYTLRNVPDALDEALRRTARKQDKSLNEVAIEALARGVGITGELGQRDLSDIAGTWRKDPAFDEALAAQDTIDEVHTGILDRIAHSRNTVLSTPFILALILAIVYWFGGNDFRRVLDFMSPGHIFGH